MRAARREMRPDRLLPLLLLVPRPLPVSAAWGRAVMELVTARALSVRPAAPERQRLMVVINDSAGGAVGTPQVTAWTFPGLA
jgi:hypothetical protein